jgi:5-oxoprolinase (ATP-hydrolysing)
LCERYGYEVYQAATDDLLVRNRAAISHIIDTKIGTERSSFTDFIDDNGLGVGPWAISCSMQKKGGKLVFDWDGTSPQSASSMNFYLSITMFKMVTVWLGMILGRANSKFSLSATTFSLYMIHIVLLMMASTI